MSWLNLNLVPYIAKTRILPDTQVAMQQGIQTRDLMSYLAAIKCWAKRHKGMYDAVTTYGLPPAIIDLDHAAQTDTKCFIRTAHGITEPIIITGVTKQDDTLQAKVVMATEATDDSYIFVRLLPSLRHNALAMERFQYDYGWLTQWRKSVAYVLEPTSNPPDYAEFDSITNHRRYGNFLRAKVDDPCTRFEELKNFIDDFTFPKFLRCPPITLLWKIVKQNIISKARALLSLQPIKRADAEDLDRRIKNKIHLESGMPFTPSSDVLTLPTPVAVAHSLHTWS
ncbi:hypothetical protein FB451DRAFT_1409931 [Mycena latifolia]|nr:hypothetical protein FB451DRAFT_1409931 [Mycena latifolia]